MDDGNLKNVPKRLHPHQKSTIISKIFFCWALPLFYRQYKNELTEEEYQTVLGHDSKKLGDKLEKVWNSKRKSNPNMLLWKSLWKCFGLQLIGFLLVFLFNELVLKFSQPILIGKLMALYQNNDISTNYVYMYCFLILLSSCLNVILSHTYMLKVQEFGITIRIACRSLIYRKSLKLNKAALNENSSGKIINLLSNDAPRLDFAPMFFIQMCTAPVETIVIMCALYIIVGWTAIAGILFLSIFVPVQMYMGKLTQNFRSKIALRTDSRIKWISEVIAGIQVIKMHAWENEFIKIIKKARRHEIQQLRFNSFLKAINVSFMIFLNRTGIFLCILLYVISENRIDAGYVFTVSAFYAMLRQALTVYLPLGISNSQEARVSIERINQFLVSSEVESRDIVTYVLSSSNSTNVQFTKQPLEMKPIMTEFYPKIQIDDFSIQWNSSPSPILRHINFEAKLGEIVGIIGRVGCGKSTFLLALLNEIPNIRGNIDVHGICSYASQEPWLFSGSIRQNILFGQKMNETKYKTVLKVCCLEYDLENLGFGDRTRVGDKGMLLSGGQKARINLARAIYKDADIYLFDDPLSAVDPEVSRFIFENCFKDYLKEKCVILVTHQLQYLSSVNKVYSIDQGTMQLTKRYENENAEDMKITEDTESKFEDPDTNEKKGVKSERRPIAVVEKRNTGNVLSRVYVKYLKAAGGSFIVILLCLLFILTQLGASGLDYYVGFWVNLEQKENSYDFHLHVYIYIAIIIFTIIVTVIRSIMFFNSCLRASIKIHNQMLRKIIKAPLIFFTNNPAGQILNRFSYDINLIDNTLPTTAMDTLQIAFIVGGLILILVVLNPWSLIPVILMLLFLYFFKIIFLTGSRNLKHMEAITISPINSHVGATLQGLTTIRVSGVQNTLTTEFDNYQNINTSAAFAFMISNRAFAFWLDMSCVIFSIVVVVAIIIKETLVGNIGVAITQATSLTGVFQWGIRQWSELENQMTSVERLIEYSQIEPEQDLWNKKPPPAWPNNGEICYDSVSFKYSSTDPIILKNLSFHVQANEKIGVIGRTGAGKSSLISALFRFGQLSGTITIDGVNIEKISLESLRSNISIIPQSPVLFSDTLRKNLDFLNEFKDNQILDALERVRLIETVSRSPEGIYQIVQESGSNYSVGEKQLICLARAILRKHKILILDEATANVDPGTEEMIQAALKLEFKDCTVLTIAHRINTIIDSDKVLVLDDGELVEFDNPHNLLQKEDSSFTELVNSLGEETADKLKAIAKKKFQEMNQ